MRHRIVTLFIATLLMVPAISYAGLTSMRGPLFDPTDNERARAEALGAPLLAPLSWGEGVDNYERADSTFKRAGSIDSIRRYLAKAEEKFNKSAQAAEIAATALDTAIQARKDAYSSEAPQYATESWHEGETNFLQATQRLESGSIKYAQRYAKKAETAYRDGELIAIKVNYLSETKSLIDRAEKLRAVRYAPMSLNNARILLDTAETELTTSRYDTDRPRLLARDAKHNALHAIYVSKLELSIRDGITNLEAVLLEWEASISKIGDRLDKPLYFDDGETAAIDEVLAAIGELQQQNKTLAQDLNDRDAHVSALNMKMQQLLGGGNQTIEELETLLEQQARHRERFARVETLFHPEQAEVFRQGDVVIIRMVGLNFDSGTARLKNEHVSMLDILENAINEFPQSRVIVEGHTDAFGSDSENLDLSETRAQNVVQHLLSSMPISPVILRSVGYGETRPVANNETEQGRKRNRRIDVVIKPSWVANDSIASVEFSNLRLDIDR